MGRFAFGCPRDPDLTSTYANDDLIYQTSPGMRKGDAIGRISGIDFLSGEELVQKLRRIVDLSGLGQQIDNLTQRVHLRASMNLKRDLFGIDQIDQGNG